MTTIDLDARGWRSRADFYAALLPRLGAEPWVGGNLDALFDCLGGGIARLDPPFAVIVRNVAGLPAEELAYIRRAEQVFEDARAEFGRDVRLRFV
ncbi:barstar family protein [Sphingomonas melonis]|uniref:RNAse (Barnase) inhibitor barstar n=1 Tax=Sphingomonas melonis TaxID=152682 RepID=A0A7Y9FPU7_9SPHN|nr:RNAse (barnase) inhibitor barstar [Sphingomonas melonis]